MAEDSKNEGNQIEKPLDKMTVLELREVAMQEIPDLVGVTGMKKSELLQAIKEARGIVDEAPAKKKKTAGPRKDLTVKEMKQEIMKLRAERESLRKEKDKKRLEIIRKKINRLKKRTRKAA